MSSASFFTPEEADGSNNARTAFAEMENKQPAETIEFVSVLGFNWLSTLPAHLIQVN